jgi:hypothetical protein
MSTPLVLILPFVLAATRSLTLGIQSPDKVGSQLTLQAETEYELLRIVTLCLLGLLVTLTLMMRFPDFGGVFTECNQF